MRDDDCPLCGGSSRPRFVVDDVPIRDCTTCSHRFAVYGARADHVARTYDDGYFRDGGAGYPGYLSEESMLTERGRWYGALLGGYAQPGLALDVGAAAGFWLRGLGETGWEVRGIEPNPAMAEHARRQVGVEVDVATLDDFVTEDRFDLVSLIQVVAHFVDVRKALDRVSALIRPSGFLLVETWNRESWTARCFGRRWHEYSPPSVLHWFSPDGLASVAARHGFREIARGRPPKRISGAHAKSLLRFKYGASGPGRMLVAASSIVPDGLTLPYPAEDLFWMLLRASAD